MRNFFEYLWFGLEMFFSLVILIISIMFTVASIHNINMTEDIKQFIESATFEFETNGTYYYKVTDTSLDEDTLMYDEVSGKVTFGKTGDFFLMPQSRMDYVPMFAEFVSYLFGGHAGVIINNGAKTVEAMGGSADQSYVYEWYSDLHTEDRTTIGMRVVGSTKEERAQAAENAKTLVGKPYNYLFVLDTYGKYYCTDICHRIYSKEFGMNYLIDDNGFHVSLQDLFRSNQTQITFVKYMIGDKTYIYYADNPNI